MIFRKTTIDDIKKVMKIIDEAKEYFREMNIDQWQDGYPNEEVILSDIKSKNSYVLENNKEIVATAMFALEKDETYDKIYEGKWLTDKEYAVIHRIAVSTDYKGSRIAAEIIENAAAVCLEHGITSIKIDTHKDNISMQKFLANNGFEYCGIIYLEDNSERVAFEKVIEN